MHFKFFGVMMLEVLLSNKHDEGILYSVLPVLAQALKSAQPEVKHSGLLAIG